jgi:hypothetical protein
MVVVSCGDVKVLLKAGGGSSVYNNNNNRRRLQRRKKKTSLELGQRTNGQADRSNDVRQKKQAFWLYCFFFIDLQSIF